MASRHIARSIVMQTLFEWDFWGRDMDKLNRLRERNIEEFGAGIEEEYGERRQERRAAQENDAGG